MASVLRRFTSEGKPVGGKKPLGEILVEGGVINRGQLDQALRAQADFPGKKLGEILVLKGFVSAARIEEALGRQSLSGGNSLAGGQAQAASGKPIELPPFPADMREIAALDGDPATGALLYLLAGRHGQAMVQSWVAEARRRGAVIRIESCDMNMLAQIKSVSQDSDAANLSVVRNVRRIIAAAVAEEASDIHLTLREREGGKGYMQVQFRVKGSLEDRMQFTQTEGAQMIRAMFQGMAAVADASYRETEDQHAVIVNPALLRSETGQSLGLSGIRLARAPLYDGMNLAARLLYRLEHADTTADLIGMLGYSPRQIKVLRKLSRQTMGINPFTGPTGCHAKGHPILMADGSVKAVEQVKVGDCVMGPDSRPRKVLRLHRGIGQMVRIVPVKGEPFVVNLDHILALKRTPDGTSLAGSVQCLTVREYLSRSTTFRHTHKLFRTGVEFPKNAGTLPMNPYLLGVILGDGSISGSYTVDICNPDGEIQDEIRSIVGQDWVSARGPSDMRLTIRHPGNHNHQSGGENPYRSALRSLGLMGAKSGDKFVPMEYKIASLSQRLEVLAGLLDTDGYLQSGVYDYISKSRRLADDVVFLARSCGLAAYMAPSMKYSQHGVGGMYYRVSISGNCEKIPCRVARKTASRRLQKKSALVSGFSVEDAGIGAYFGFALDGDHLYVDGTFTVHHNSGKSSTLANMIRTILRIRPGNRIITIEDPVEFEFDSDFVWQYKIANANSDEDKSRAFSGKLKTALRQDPDIIMVGEIRGLETAREAVNAAITGHQVWTTLHVSDPFMIVQRLVAMGIDGFYLQDPKMLSSLIAQRLIKTLCPHCAVTATREALVDDGLDPEDWDNLAGWADGEFPLSGVRMRGPGCDHCHGTGIQGRTVVAQVIPTDEELLLDMVQHGPTAARRNYLLRTDAEIPMEAHAVLKILRGIVDPRFVVEMLGPIPRRPAELRELTPEDV